MGHNLVKGTAPPTPLPSISASNTKFDLDLPLLPRFSETSLFPFVFVVTEWAVELLQCTASLPEAAGSATPAVHCLTAWGQWLVELLEYTASQHRGSGQWDSCNPLPYCLGAMGIGTLAIHCLTIWGLWAVRLLQCLVSRPGGRWAVELLQYSASLPGGSG